MKIYLCGYYIVTHCRCLGGGRGRLIKFLRWAINNWLILPYTDVCIALSTQCFPSICGKTSLGRDQTNDLLLTSADVFTSQPPSLPDEDRPARILYSSGFCDIYRLMKFLHRVINNWFNFALHRRMYSTVYSVLSGCLRKKTSHVIRAGFEPWPPAHSKTCSLKLKKNVATWNTAHESSPDADDYRNHVTWSYNASLKDISFTFGFCSAQQQQIHRHLQFANKRMSISCELRL